MGQVMDNLSPAEKLDLIFVFSLGMSWDKREYFLKISLDNRKYRHRNPVGSSFPSS